MPKVLSSEDGPASRQCAALRYLLVRLCLRRHEAVLSQRKSSICLQFESGFAFWRSGYRTRRETHRRIPEGLARVMAEGAGRAVGIVRSVHGASARVASRATGAFQCLVSALDRQGYPIRFMGGYRAHGSVRYSLHPMGLALDINQYGRNRTQPRMPANEVALANSCGLISGAQWASRDSGHFQLGGWSGGNSRRGARGRLHRRR